jgi:CDP-glycerol glycerophosphotransferase
VPRISVVVPVYNVERYLTACLESIAAQTVDDFDVVMVDDGSTDGSAAIAAAFAERDPRFRLVSQPNGGLSKARNTGIDHTAGEFLSFVDSDDMLTPRAYELLLGALEETGSDFASGNVLRFTSAGERTARFLAKAFAETRLRTHITKDHRLLADRTAWNKLWRRAFWDRHGLRFPEGRIYEDIPVVLPLHFAAKSVDIVSEPVYRYRIREGTDLSITQRRAEVRALRDRLAAVEEVVAFLHRNGPRRALRWYYKTVVTQDLRYFLNVIDEGDAEYQALFMERVNAFLEEAPRRVFRGLPAIERLKWYLVRRRMLPELLEIRRFQREDLGDTPPVRIRGRWYADHPYRTDPSLGIPRELFRVDRELVFSAQFDDVRWDGNRLALDGWAFIGGVGAPARDSQHVTLTALRPGRLRRVRLRAALLRARATPVHRPDLPGIAGVRLCDVSWAGFAARLDPRRLRRPGRWDLYVTARVGRVRRRSSRFPLDGARPLRALELPRAGERAVWFAPTPEGELRLEVRARWATLRRAAREGDALELSGDLGGVGPRELQVRREDGRGRHAYPVTLTGDAFRARIPLADLAAGPALVDADAASWSLHLAGHGARVRPAVGADGAAGEWLSGAREVALAGTQAGDAVLLVRAPRATVRAARWSDDGTLELEGDTRVPDAEQELVLFDPGTLRRHAFPLTLSGGRFSVRVPAARLPSLGGELPLPEGVWELQTRTAATDPVPVMLDPALHRTLPLETVVAHKPFSLAMTPAGRATLGVRRDLELDERGGFQQRRLRATVYTPARARPLRDAVVFDSFRGRQFSDSPRAIHAELVRREAPLEHLWVVRDGQCHVPDGVTALRAGGREHYAAMAQARYVVANDHFPDWFVRRADQTCLQTWHGTPLKRLGFDVSESLGRTRRFERRWEEQVGNWQYVLSPNRFTTPILRRAYAIEGELLELGYPRNDVLAGAQDGRRAALRQRLGLPEEARVVLYAPTYRDQVRDDRGRYRLEPALDLERLRAAVGDDTVVLFRKHHYIVDPVPATADGFVRDVSDFPDGTELMLAADVLLTDYSSMMFDFANSSRPMLFFTYDLARYEDEIRGFYFDFEAEAPGPLLATTDAVGEALRELDAVTATYADRYRAFAARYCEFDDGHAAARVVERIFSAAC